VGDTAPETVLLSCANASVDSSVSAIVGVSNVDFVTI